MPMNTIKIHGLQRTGTNYTSWLIKNNFPTIWITAGGCGSKHGEVYLLGNDNHIIYKKDPNVDRVKKMLKAKEDGELGFIFTFKNPYSWIVSFSKYRHKNPNNPRHYRQWMSNYNELNEHFINASLGYDQSYILRYEDLIAHPELCIKRIASKFSLQFEEFKDMNKVIEPKGKISNKSFNKGFYDQHKYLEALDSSTIEYITNNVSSLVMTKCEYDYV